VIQLQPSSLTKSIDSNNNNLATHSEAIVETLNSLLMWEEPEIQYNAAGALFNMMAMSGEFDLWHIAMK
jgi:hypothetical protein